MKTKIRFGFKSKNQSPLFMVWREYIEDGVIVFAAVIWMLLDLWKPVKFVLLSTGIFALIFILLFAWNKQLEREAAWEVSQEIAGYPHG